MKTAVCQVADTGPLESLVVMLRRVGYKCLVVGSDIQDALKTEGCDTVVSISHLVNHWGYEEPMHDGVASMADMDSCDLFVDIKAHRNGPKVWRRWPRLEKRTLWYRINGSKPEHVINARGDHGDECNPPCPVLTPNLWYRRPITLTTDQLPLPLPFETYEKSYACWPPFYRFNDYYRKWGRYLGNEITKAICLVHNFQGWGYGAMLDTMRELGVMVNGRGSPDGLIPHRDVPRYLASALAMVHLKSSDAPGYALYEGLAAACPMIVSRRLIWRNAMQDMFEPGINCIVFDRETHDGLSEKDVQDCRREIKEGLELLADPVESRRIGLAGYERLKELQWNERRDGASLCEFMGRMFP